LRSYFGDIVALQGIPQSLPGSCTARLDATSVCAAAPLLSHKFLALQIEQATTNFDCYKKKSKELQILIEIWMITYTNTFVEAAE